jgi:hypothetical protein
MLQLLEHSNVDANKPRQKIMDKNDILFSSGYAGGEAKCNILIDGIYHVLELDQVRDLIVDAMENHGYEIVKTNKQKYPRVSINHLVYCAHFQCRNKREVGSDSCSGHQFCECEKLSGKHYVMNH